MDIFDQLMVELKQQYECNAIIAWSSIPFKIKKCIIRSIRHHQGSRNKVYTGPFGELSWTISSSNNQPFDDEIDSYLISVVKMTNNGVWFMSDSNYAEIVNDLKVLL